MSYAMRLRCGCGVYVACHPRTGAAHTRIIEQRGPGCPIRTHDVGVRLQSSELRPHAIVPDVTMMPGDRRIADHLTVMMVASRRSPGVPGSRK